MIELNDEDKRFIRRALTERGQLLEGKAEEATEPGAAESFRRGAHRLFELAREVGNVLPVLFAGSGVTEIAEERERQIWQEGRTAEHDAEHVNGEMAWAAAAYAAPGPVVHEEDGTDIWPWDPQWDKRQKHDRVKRLRIAGALCAAEIDRLKRSA